MTKKYDTVAPKGMKRTFKVHITHQLRGRRVRTGHSSWILSLKWLILCVRYHCERRIHWKDVLSINTRLSHLIFTLSVCKSVCFHCGLIYSAVQTKQGHIEGDVISASLL